MRRLVHLRRGRARCRRGLVVVCAAAHGDEGERYSAQQRLAKRHPGQGTAYPDPVAGEGRSAWDDDDYLMGRSIRDPEAFALFYDRHHRAVAAWFYRRTMCAHTSADLCAETFARALAGAARFDSDLGTARAWLFGIASHLHRGWLRRGRVDDRARRRLGLERLAVDDATLEEIEASVDLAPMETALRSALDGLSAPLRDAVVTRVGLGLPYADVASMLGVSEGAARVRVSRGLAQLHAALEVAG